MLSDDRRMERVKIAPEYDAKWLEVERPQSLCDNYLESLFSKIMTGFDGIEIDHRMTANSTFKETACNWILNSRLNHLTGFDNFNRVDIINGCTQFIDNIYMSGTPQIIVGDYRYHDRLGNWGTYPGLLKKDTPLIIAMPFPSTGAVHNRMTEILNEAQDNGIDVHVDGAWLTCCRGINFDVSHPAIKSVGISLSKGLGLGWNRIGLRWSKGASPDSISIMNDFHMELRMGAIVGNYILDNVQSDYLWNSYGDLNAKICKDFNLTPSNAIHMAFNQDGNFVGLSPLLRNLME
jgi:hypothetical protein